MTGFRATDHEINHDGDPLASGGIEAAVVEAKEGGVYYDVEADGPTFVHVRLSRGTPGDRATLWCRISQPLNYIPTPGTSVIVAIPAGFGYSPGAAMIIAASGPAPANQFGDAKAKLDFGPDYDLVIKARSITLTDYENRYLTVGPDYGVKIGDASASGAILKDAKWAFYVAESGDAKAVFELSTDKVQIVQKDSKQTALLMRNGEICLAGTTLKAMCASGYLGNPASVTPANGIAYSVAGPANVVSTSWFVASA